jgi:hypothetical protein
MYSITKKKGLNANEKELTEA